jgi:flagellar biosynthesis/type III secretory pathway ATPase
MAPDPLRQIVASYGQLLAATGAYYERLQRQLDHPDLSPASRDEIQEALTGATQLIEVLETVTFDRIQRLTSAPLPA